MTLNPNAFLPTLAFGTIGLALVEDIGFWDGNKYYQWHTEKEDDNIVWDFLTYLRDHYKEFQHIKIFAQDAAHVVNRFIFHELEKREEIMAFLPTFQSLTWTKEDIKFDDSSLHFKKPEKYLKDKGIANVTLDELYRTARKLPGQSTVALSLEADVVNLSKALTAWYKDWWQSFGVEPSTTYMTTTMSAIRKNFCTADFDLSKNATKFNLQRKTETFVRKATYGMRNEVYKRFAPEGHYMHGDIHSFFPSCYDTDIPMGEIDWKAPDLDDPLAALAEVDVYVPEDLYIGPLPYHHPELGLIFPTGYIPKTWYDVKELKNAVEKFGVKITKHHRQLDCERWSPMLREFGRAISDNTLFPKSNKKLIAIGPSGKMGQHRWRTEVKHWSQMKDVEFHSFIPIGENESYLELLTFNKSPYIMPAVTMRVRAEGRIRHLDVLVEAHKNGDIFYCDSDSVFCTLEAIPTVEIEKAKVGDLILIDEFTRGYFIRQKLYGVIVPGGKMYQRSAGYSDLKLSEGDFEKLLNDETILDLEFKSLSSLKQQLNTRELEVFERHMSVRGTQAASRTAIGYDTKPIYLEEVN